LSHAFGYLDVSRRSTLFCRTGFNVFVVILAVEIDTEITAEIKTEVEIERGVAIFSKIIFFFFGRCSISVGVIGDSTIVISSTSEILILEVDLIYY